MREHNQIKRPRNPPSYKDKIQMKKLKSLSVKSNEMPPIPPGGDKISFQNHTQRLQMEYAQYHDAGQAGFWLRWGGGGGQNDGIVGLGGGSKAC